jgi:hypothetical protein
MIKEEKPSGFSEINLKIFWKKSENQKVNKFLVRDKFRIVA